MSNIKFFVTTDLYWQTLEQYAGHALFPLMRKKIDECVHRKLSSPNFRNSRDKPFDVDPRLAGIWHCKLSEEIDAVLFYKIHGDTLYLTMVGSHHDYPADGRNGNKATPLAEKLRNAVAAGHVDHPGRCGLKWTRPKDLIGNPMLDETDAGELYSILDVLRAENDEGALFKRLSGVDIMDASEQVFDDWLREVMVATIEVERAIRRIDMGSISRRDRREISSLVPVLEFNPEEILRRDGHGFSVEGLVGAIKDGVRERERLGRSDRRTSHVIDDFEADPLAHSQNLLVVARRLAVDLARKSHDADRVASEIERLVDQGEAVLGDPDCHEMQDYLSSRSIGYR